MTTIELIHGRVHLALHELRKGEGTAILLLHALGGSAADWANVQLAWSGPIYALDLSGHGYSGHARGGGYTAEVWLADADLALAQLGDDAVVIGAGVSAYVAVELAGARPDSVRGALLLPGAGLFGGGEEPDFAQLAMPLTASQETGALRPLPLLDHAVLFTDLLVRPSWYLQALVPRARCLVLSEDSAERPLWWRALHRQPNVHVDAGGSLASGLTLLAYRAGLERQLEAMHTVQAG
jgi:pimeloyl-ACP methyl ester carboxylesterase